MSRCYSPLPLAAAAFVVLAGMTELAHAQGTPADYARAVGLRERYEAAAGEIAGTPTAIGATHRFWYRKSVKGGDQFLIVDADTGATQPAFDHERIAQALSRLTGATYTALTLPFNTLTFVEDGSAFTATVGGSPYRCSLADSTCRAADAGPRAGAGLGVGRRPRDERPRLSPDGRWEALVNNYNIVIRQPGTRALTRLSTDGSEGNYYTSRRLPGRRTRRRSRPIESGLGTGAKCTTSNRHRRIRSSRNTRRFTTRSPATCSTWSSPFCSSVAAKQQTIVDNALFPNAYANSDWSGGRTAARSPSNTTSAGTRSIA